MILWLFIACGSKVSPAPQPSRPASQTEKTTAPVRVERTPTPEGSGLDFLFESGGQQVVIEVWGTRGLEFPADRVREDVGVVKRGEQIHLDVSHRGEGDLAVRIGGSWNGVVGDDVRSFGIGAFVPTAVPTTPVEGTKVKGWEATRR